VVPERFAPVLAELAPLADRFSAAGHRLYLVGGTVRDLLLGKPDSVDYDATTDARPDQIKKLISTWADSVWNQGEKFGTIGAKVGDRVYEITTHRAEVYQTDSRKPEVEFTDAIEADLSRRDFTVNAMALELTSATRLVERPT
jgi:poly(A) polymerase